MACPGAGLWRRGWHGFDGDAANGDGMVHHHVLMVGLVEESFLLRGISEVINEGDSILR